MKPWHAWHAAVHMVHLQPIGPMYTETNHPDQNIDLCFLCALALNLARTNW